LGDTYPEDDLL